jgi:hypothetical protein
VVFRSKLPQAGRPAQFLDPIRTFLQQRKNDYRAFKRFFVLRRFMKIRMEEQRTSQATKKQERNEAGVDS